MSKKDKINESLEKMKRLNEFHFKTSGSQREMPISENPVKFNEIGDKYKAKPKSDYPSFDQYLDEVVLDEEDPNPEDENQPAQQEPTPQGQQAPAQPEQQPVQPQAAPEPAPQPEPVAPAPEPAMTQPEPTPVAATEPTVVDNSGGLDSQIDKNDAILSQITLLSQKLDMLDAIPEKIAHLSKEVEEIKNPSLDDEMEMISKNSYPFNIKLGDYWNWEEKENAEPEEEQEFSASPEEIESYNKDDIKKSFNVDSLNEEFIKMKKNMDYKPSEYINTKKNN